VILAVGLVAAAVTATFWSRHDRAALNTAFTRVAALGARIDAPNKTHATVLEFTPTVPGKANDITAMPTKKNPDSTPDPW